MAEARKVQVFLVDDHPLVRESLSNLILQQADMCVCGEADESARACQGIMSSTPDVIVMDISLKDSSGLELLKDVQLRNPAIKIVVLSMHDEKLYAERCIRAGARAYVMKAESSRRILFAIREVVAGRLCLSETMSAALTEKFVGLRGVSQKSPLSDLSDRELQVYHLLGKGLETRQIATSLNVSIKTIQAYCARIKLKLGLATGSELLREAIRWHENQGDVSDL